MSIQVQAARNSFERLKRDLTDVSNATFSEWCHFVNRFLYDQLKGIDAERFINQATTYTITTSPSTQALPATFKDISSWNTGFFLIDSGANTDTRLAMTGFGSTSKGYYFQGTNVVFTGIENNTGEQYRLRFFPEITVIDALTDYFTLDNTQNGIEIVPDDYMELIVKALDVLYSQWDEDQNAEIVADARFVRVLNDFFTTMKKEPNVYGLPDFSTIY